MSANQRGYFGVGVEGINKPMNIGAIVRTAHAFGAGFVFTVADTYEKHLVERADTARTAGAIPYYRFPDVDRMVLPQGCKLIAVELTDDAIELPSFHHPAQAAYVLGPERGSVSAALQAKCDYTLKIPTRFCVNVSVAAAVLCYDRMLSLGRFAPRPFREGGPTETRAQHVSGKPIFRTEAEAYRADPPPLLADPRGTLADED